ncbi:Late embryogenesis abundant protein Lea14-A-like protein [Drosera capensis]
MAGLIDKAKNFVAEKIADIPKPEASIDDVDIRGVARDGVTYNAKVDVKNPYGHSLPVCEVSYTLKSAGRTYTKSDQRGMVVNCLRQLMRGDPRHILDDNEFLCSCETESLTRHSLAFHGRVILSGKMEDPGSIAANQTTKLEVPMKVARNIIVSLVKDVGSDWDIDYELDLGLTVDLPVIGNFTIPLSTKGEIKLPSLKDIF